MTGATLALSAAETSQPQGTASDLDAGRQFWAFQQPERHAAPAVERRDWPRRPIDYFILARLEAEGLEPTAAADRRTWIRRVTFDLIGLPPAPEAVESFVADESPDAAAQVVERLLASPQHGERWARLWLDIARYAEDQAHIVGNDKSLFYPNAYLYRDWVIRALNADVPYDRFIKLQLAADLIAPEQPEEHAALGFLGLGPKYYSRRSKAVMADEWEDRVDTVCRGLLGLTVACARCHDHKFDPIPTADYYALAGVFASTEMFNRPLAEGAETKDDGQAKEPKDAMHMVREGKPQDLPVFVRGDVKNEGPLAPRHFLQVVSTGDPQPFQSGSGRKELAESIASRENPLTARVVVNRVWGAFFGQPLVGTPSNFGALGEEPTHPELLDDLAVRFMENGWSLKWLHREIALSATYAQASKSAPDEKWKRLQAADPENRLLGRMTGRRLSVEQWRDAVLAVADRLDQAIGGPSIDPQDPEATRRTVYSEASRLELNPMLVAFDYPDPNIHSDGRAETTTPLQKLFVMNSPFMLRNAEALAERLMREVPDSDDADRQRIEQAYQVLFSRPPTHAELEVGLSFILPLAPPAENLQPYTQAWLRYRESSGEYQKSLQQYVHALLASNEMWFID